MYNKRIIIFIILSLSILGVCVTRLADMQLRENSFYQERIKDLKSRRGNSYQLKTLRGSILDRNGKILAEEDPTFKLKISYQLAKYMDERVIKAMLLKAKNSPEPTEKLANLHEEIKNRKDELTIIIDKCFLFGYDKDTIEKKINSINDRIWMLRTFQAWRKNCTESPLFNKNKNNLIGVSAAKAIKDFKKYYPDKNKRLLKVLGMKIYEMYRDYELFTLETDDDIFAAQFEFMNINGVSIDARSRRRYPYKKIASQTIGWVGVAQKRDKKLFQGQPLVEYKQDEVCGRSGVEYVCEKLLRGRRGQKLYDIDRNLIGETDPQFGLDVRLTIDIELQKRIEEMLIDPDLNKNYDKPCAAVVLDAVSGDILSLVSVPRYDLNYARYDYGELLNNPAKPLTNRAIYSLYPPGSLVKPLILVAGLEENEITEHEVISCPPRRPPKGWPRCWIQKRYSWRGHDDEWLNTGRNAIKGSCNIYFSRLADRLDSRKLQKWFYDFGYGRRISLAPSEVERNFRQSAGAISSKNPPYGSTIKDFNDIPTMIDRDKRWFGIGQGNFRATPLHAANTMAVLARRGFAKKPRLFLDEPQNKLIDLNISEKTLDTVLDGMNAVVNEPGGTAYKEFAPADLSSQGVNLYGKTGSTEYPFHAWFAGFAEDGKGRKIALSVIVEGGAHGSSDAAPLGRDIFQYCIEAGYVGEVKEESVYED